MRTLEKLILVGAGAAGLWGWREWRRSRRRIHLAGRVVLITGATSGHGLILARQAARQGAHLVLAARTFDDLAQAETDLLSAGAPSVVAMAVDVADDAQVRALVETTIELHGRIDILINNAGTITVGAVETMTVDDFQEVMATNFWGAIHTTMAVLPHMRARRFGRIGNVVSLGGKRAVPHMLPYTASKFALAGLTEGLRAELAKDNIFVTGLYPSTMRTGSQQHAEFKGNRDAEYTWFALSATLPGVASSAESVASAFWRGILDGEFEVVIGWSSYLAILLHDLLPNESSEILALADRLLPTWEGGPSASVRGEDLEGRMPSLLNQVVPSAARPHGPGPEA
jgi:NAD(P)-dependent dehydrogenase (short-subunit alcohol dehydrogenase family)